MAITTRGKFEKFIADYNLMTPEDMDAFLYSPFGVSLGAATRKRLQTQYDNYKYYEGKQHRNIAGALVNASELERPDGADYDPTRYATNYFKAIINRKARWQMGGKHNVVVPRKQIDDTETIIERDYTPSQSQKRSDEISEGYEKLLQQLYRENKMRAKLIQAARDRLIATRVVCKLVFNPRTGRLNWVFRPDTEYFPIYSDDDLEELIACHFIRQMVVEVKGEDKDAFLKQTFRLEPLADGSYECFTEEGIYLAEDLSLFEPRLEYQPMDIDFIPVVEFSINDVISEDTSESEVAGLREQNDVLNQMNEDAIDSLKFEMFPITTVTNATPGTAAQMQIAPGATIEAQGSKDGLEPKFGKLEGKFTWTAAFKDQYMRVKASMHEVSGLPQIVPQELNFGGLNGDALQILFHDIISDTEEHWLEWGYGLQELHEKSIKYLKTRLSESNFHYDKTIVRQIEDYTTEIRFQLPLPDNRKELVELLGLELTNQLESQAGAMERLGVEDIKLKRKEIEKDQLRAFELTNPYGMEGIAGDNPTRTGEAGKLRNDSGEEVEKCATCNGTGVVGGETCSTCRGDGYMQVRKR